MKLEIKNGGKLDSLFPREAVPEYIEDKATYYDTKKLQQWEQRYNEILVRLKESDYREGIEPLFSLAEEGYPEARMLLSDMYIEGRGLPESFQKAVEWDRRARFAEKLYREMPPS
jgi:TPR repeat protein